RIERKAVLSLADMANPRTAADQALRLGRGLEHDLDRRRDGLEGPDRGHRRVDRALLDEPVLDDLLAGLGGLEDGARAVHAGEVPAAARAIVVGRDDELHRVAERLSLEAQIDDAARLGVRQPALRRVARRL